MTFRDWRARHIDPMIAEIDAHLADIEHARSIDFDETRRMLLFAIDSIVRPVSKELVDPDRAPLRMPDTGEERSIAPLLDRPVDIRRIIDPVRSTVVLTVLDGVGLLSTDATDWHYPLRMLACVAALPFLIGIQHLPTSLARMARPAAIIVVSLAFITWFYLSRVIYEIAIDVFGVWSRGPLPLFRPLVLIGPASIILANANASRAARAELARELAEVNSELEFLVAGLRIAEWVERRHLSLQLHGPLQSSLLSAAMLLSRPTIGNEEISQARRALAQTATGIDADRAQQATLRSAIESMAHTWRHTCTITLDMPDAVSAAVDARPGQVLHLTELVREAISNAVRHGHATAVTVAFVEPSDRMLELQVRDNGSGPPASSTPGLGTALLDETAYAWSLQIVEAGTLLRVLVPLADERDDALLVTAS